MAFLVIGGTTIEVSALDGVTREDEEIGGRARAHDGTMNTTVRTRKKVWRVTTKPLTATDADAIETAITATASFTCSGDLVDASGGNLTCHVEMTGNEYMPRPSDSRGFVRRIQFRLIEE